MKIETDYMDKGGYSTAFEMFLQEYITTKYARVGKGNLVKYVIRDIDWAEEKMIYEYLEGEYND